MLFPLYDLNPHHRVPWLTLLIIVANVGIMLWLNRMDPRAHEMTVIEHGFVPKRLTKIDSNQPVVAVFEQARDRRNPAAGQDRLVVQFQPNPREVYFSFFSMMFLHGGWLHLISNMWMLWVFGNNIEDRLGHVVYVVFYLLGGIVACLVHWMSDPSSTMPVIGASGAVAAVLGAYAVSYPTAKVRTLVFFGIILLLDLPALVVLGVWFLLQMFEAGLGLFGVMQESNVAFWAHIGGFIAGAIMIPIFAVGAPPADEDWQQESDDSFRFEETQR